MKDSDYIVSELHVPHSLKVNETVLLENDHSEFMTRCRASFQIDTLLLLPPETFQNRMETRSGELSSD